VAWKTWAMSDPRQVQRPEPAVMLPVGDPRRRAIGRAAFGTLWASIVFFVFTVPAKQVKPLYDHAPWLNDPYDTIYSFAMFFVPLAAAFFLVQVSLCRKSGQLAVSRVRSILRGCQVTAIVMAATIVSCWVSVADGANRSGWTAGATVALIGGLVVVTALTLRAIVALLWAPRFPGPAVPAGARGADWLGDAVAVANRESRRFGPLRPGIGWVVARLDRTVVVVLRRHPVAGAALASTVFGLGAGINQGVRENYFLALTALTAGLLTCGMFAFLMLAGSYLNLVARSGAPMRGLRRRFLDASVAACVGALVGLAFRNSLWWAVGTSMSAAGNGQFASLLAAVMLVAFVGALGVESVLGTHARRPM
jgi:hypothetical protein